MEEGIIGGSRAVGSGSVGGALCVQAGRGQVFVTFPFQAARIGLLRGGCRMAPEGFTATGETEEGAEFGLGWQVCANILYLL